MDYSLLVGLHFREAATDGQASGLRTPTGYFASFSEIVFLVIKLEQVNYWQRNIQWSAVHLHGPQNCSCGCYY